MTTKRETYRDHLARQPFGPALEAYLLEHSGLPGRRANLELAAALADHVRERSAERATAYAALETWASIDAEQAPTNSRREYLPFCALQALGAVYCAVDGRRRETIAARLRDAARNPRWRTREAACFGLQRVGEADRAELLRLLRAWPDPTPMELRAMLVALAHPPLLEHAEVVDLALELADQALRAIDALDAGQQATEPWRVLRKGLEFAPSVFTAAAPARGFEQLERWARWENVQIKKIVAANLRKARLARHFPDEVEAVGERLSSE